MSVFDAVDDVDGRRPDGRVAEQPGRRHLSERQAEVMERLVAAAAEEAEERPYAEITVRTIAKRAGVAPATAYTYFSGKDHLLAEVLWRRMQASPHLVDLEPAGARAGGRRPSAPWASAPWRRRPWRSARRRCWPTGPTSSGCASRIGAEIAAACRRPSGPRPTRRCSTSCRSPTPAPCSAPAWGTWPSTPCPPLMARPSALMTRDGRDVVTTVGAAGLQPLRLRHPRGPVPDVRPPAGRGARLLQRGARLLRLLAPRRRPGRLPRRRPLLQRLRGEPRPGRLRARRPPGDVVPGHGPAPATPACAPSSARASRPRRVAEHGGRHPGAGGRAPRARRSSARHLRLRRRLRRAPADGRDLRAGGRPAVRPGRAPPPGRPAGAPRGGDDDVPPEGVEAALDPGRLLRRDGGRPPRATSATT